MLEQNGVMIVVIVEYVRCKEFRGMMGWKKNLLRMKDISVMSRDVKMQGY